MKQLKIITTIAIVFLFISNAALADNIDCNTAPPKKGKYALLVSTENHIKVAVVTAKGLFGDPKFKADKVEVVICGKAVESIKNNSEIQNIIQEGMSMGIDFKACGISLKKAKIAPDELIKGIEVVPNGLLRIFELQEEGYKTIEL